MTLVMTLLVDGRPDLVDAQLAFHLSVGVDFVVATHEGRDAATAALLERYAGEGRLEVLRGESARPRDEARAAMARHAATEYGADWVIESEAGEFWWPRAESLSELLSAIPPRYTVVQALRRVFVLLPDGRSGVAERTVRPTLRAPTDGRVHPLGSWLRPVYRSSPELTLVRRGDVVEAWRVPLRAWYPIEIFEYGTSNAVSPDALDRGLADGSLVVDSRLADFLAKLRSGGDGGRPALVPPTNIVDDAAYAVECAALGEVDFEPIVRHIEDLEARIAVLEARFWPRLRRTARRLARRPG
jgi:hypothetical protein